MRRLVVGKVPKENARCLSESNAGGKQRMLREKYKAHPRAYKILPRGWALFFTIIIPCDERILLSAAYVAFEMLCEENKLIQNCISPIRVVVSTGANSIVVGNFFLQQRLVQSYITSVEEVLSTAIDSN